MPSAHYQTLDKNIIDLRSYFLPTINATGVYSDIELLQTIAFRIMVHAEMEDYFEQWCRVILRKAAKEFKDNGKVSLPLISTMAFSGLTMETSPDQINPPNANGMKAHEERIQLEKKIDKSIKAYMYNLNNNHGIKQSNLLSMLLGIGITHSDLDPIWLNEMDNFGVSRGLAAHTSPSQLRTTQPPDPRTENTKIIDIMQNILLIDNKMVILFNSI